MGIYWLRPRPGFGQGSGLIAQEVELFVPQVVHTDEKNYGINWISNFSYFIKRHNKELNTKT